MLKYIEPSKIGDIFDNYNLDNSNILDFLISEDNDNIKHLLKLYLLSTLEDYKHIEKLTDCIYFSQNFSQQPAYEIITKSNKKLFWEQVKQRENTPDLEKERLWISNNFETLMYFLVEKTRSTQTYEELIKRINEEKSFFKKRHLKIELKEKRAADADLEKEIKENYESFFGSLKGFDKLSSLVISSINHLKKTIQSEQKVRDSQSAKEFNPYHHSFRIVRFVLTCLDERNTIDFLKEDLAFNYYMITRLFNASILKPDSLEEMLFHIRKLMADYDLTSKDQTIDSYLDYEGLPRFTNPLGTEYRTMEITGDNDFFKKTTAPQNIAQEMSRLFEQFSNINQLTDDLEYAQKCYKLSQELLQIHPYNNGNGRTSKYLFYILLLKRNILPFTITDNNTLTPCYENTSIEQDNYFEYRNSVMTRRSGL